jgi:hypothetical protein
MQIFSDQLAGPRRGGAPPEWAERVHFGDQYPEVRFRKARWSECQLHKLLDHELLGS